MEKGGDEEDGKRGREDRASNDPKPNNPARGKRKRQAEEGRPKWQTAYENSGGTGRPGAGGELALVNSNKTRYSSIAEFLECCVYEDPITLMPVIVCTPDDVAAAVGPAVAAAVGPAVAAAVGPAVALAIAPLAAKINNGRKMASNRAAFSAVLKGTLAPAAATLVALEKESGGAGGLPGAPPPAPLPAAHPFAVGVAIPLFPATVAAVSSLSHAELNGLSILYNESFGIVAGDPVALRREKFRKWICGFC
ncbi:Protein kinase domain-containing protein [Balamuthia mandrillaris]